MSKAQNQTPRYVEVAQSLRGRLDNREFGIGMQLPTENELCVVYDVSRFTVREALRLLQEEGLISRRRGSGTIVEAPEGPKQLRQKVSSVDDLYQYAADTSFAFDSIGNVEADQRLARVLSCPVGSRWIGFSGVRTAPQLQRPVCVTDVYIDAGFTNAAASIHANEGPVIKQLERHYGVKLSRIAQDIQAIPASKAEARALKIDMHAPCLRIVRSYFDASNRAIEIAVNTHPGDNFSYSMLIEQTKI
jgi:GntR family transcriptional regulator